MKLSIILVNYNLCDPLKQCLKTLGESVKSSDYEVFIVDNASTMGR